MTRSSSPPTAPVSRRRLLEGTAALAATLISFAFGANRGRGALIAPTPASGATSEILPANATANALAPASSPGATATAAPLVAGVATPLPAPGPALLQAFNKDADMKVLDAVDWETSTASLEPFLTPTKSFFVRSHYPFPVVKQEDWKLTITGLVDRPVTLTYADLITMPSKTITAWTECAGDGRGRFTPMASGGQWTIGAVGNAEYVGVPLVDVLNMATPKGNVVDIVCGGAGSSQWARGLPLVKASDPDTMLVWQMNGEPLRVAHYFVLDHFILIP